MAARKTLKFRPDKPLVVLVPDAVDWVLGTWAREIAARNAGEFDFAIFPFGEIPRQPDRFSRILADADVVHCLTQSSFTDVSNAVRTSAPGQLPIVSSIHHIMEFEDVEPCLAADSIAVVCEEVRDTLIARGVPAERLFLLRNRIDPGFFRPGDRAAARERLGIERDGFAIGFAAKAASDDRGRKGVDVLLDVIERLSGPGKEPIRLILTGPGWEHAIEAEMPDVAVEYFPFLPRERMPDFYAALDVYVSTARVEGGPVPVLEAMSCATPVVSTRIGTVRDLVTDGEQALLVGIDDVDATIEAIGSLRADPVRARRIGEAARASILESVGSRDVLRRAREIYQPLLSDSHRTRPRRITPAELTRSNRALAASDSRRWHANAGPEPDVSAIRGLVQRLRNAWTGSRKDHSLRSQTNRPDEVAHIDLDELRVSKDSRILDLGCGTGQFSLPLLEREHRVVSVDFDAPRLREVQTACVESELEGQLARADAACLPCPTRSFDAVVCREMIEHIAEPGPVLDEIHRVLRPGGRLCVTVPSAHTERFFQWVDPRWLDMAGHVHVFSRAAMCELLTAHGFEVTEVRGRNFFYSLFWFFHTLVRTTHDGTGRIQDHFGLARRIFRAWQMLGEGRVKRRIERAGNALFPKSNVYYCVKARAK